MASFESPVKLDPSNPKKKRENISLDKCIVCQRVSLEQTVNMRDVWKSSFVEATAKIPFLRKWFKNWLASKTYILPTWRLFIIHLVIDLIRVNEIVECLKLSIIWRIQLNIFMTNNMKISLIKFKLTRYYQLSLDINTCFLCKKKTFKKDRKLHKMESRDRVKKIAKCAEESND